MIRVSVVGYHIAKLLSCSPIPMSSSSGIVLGSEGGCFVIIGWYRKSCLCKYDVKKFLIIWEKTSKTGRGNDHYFVLMEKQVRKRTIAFVKTSAIVSLAGLYQLFEQKSNHVFPGVWVKSFFPGFYFQPIF